VSLGAAELVEEHLLQLGTGPGLHSTISASAEHVVSHGRNARRFLERSVDFARGRQATHLPIGWNDSSWTSNSLIPRSGAGKERLVEKG